MLEGIVEFDCTQMMGLWAASAEGIIERVAQGMPEKAILAGYPKASGRF